MVRIIPGVLPRGAWMNKGDEEEWEESGVQGRCGFGCLGGESCLWTPLGTIRDWGEGAAGESCGAGGSVQGGWAAHEHCWGEVRCWDPAALLSLLLLSRDGQGGE